VGGRARCGNCIESRISRLQLEGVGSVGARSPPCLPWASESCVTPPPQFCLLPSPAWHSAPHSLVRPWVSGRQGDAGGGLWGGWDALPGARAGCGTHGVCGSVRLLRSFSLRHHSLLSAPHGETLSLLSPPGPGTLLTEVP